MVSWRHDTRVGGRAGRRLDASAARWLSGERFDLGVGAPQAVREVPGERFDEMEAKGLEVRVLMDAVQRYLEAGHVGVGVDIGGTGATIHESQFTEGGARPERRQAVTPPCGGWDADGRLPREEQVDGVRRVATANDTGSGREGTRLAEVQQGRGLGGWKGTDQRVVARCNLAGDKVVSRKKPLFAGLQSGIDITEPSREVGSGCADMLAAWQLNLQSLGTGALFAPRRTWRAFMAG